MLYQLSYTRVSLILAAVLVARLERRADAARQCVDSERLLDQRVSSKSSDPEQRLRGVVRARPRELHVWLAYLLRAAGSGSSIDATSVSRREWLLPLRNSAM